MAPKRFHGLDGLRGVCALSVVLLHADNLFRPGSLLQHGFLAVDMFFLLSGFVIALNYQAALEKGLGLLPFLEMRGRRLLPVFWLGAAFNLAIFIWMASSGYYQGGYGWVTIWLLMPLLTLLMVPAFGMPGGGFSPPLLHVSWSLMVEWLVNAAYARWLFSCRTRTLMWIAALGWLVMTVACYFTGRGWCVGNGRVDVFTYGLLRGVADFSAGVVISRLHARNAFAKLPAVAPEILLLLWLCIAVVPTPGATPTFDAIAVILLCPLLVVMLIRSEHKTPAFAKALGALSYPLYVVHPGIILLAQFTPVFGLNQGPRPLRAAVVLALCIAAAWLLNAVTAKRRPKALALTKSA
ncbi:MAG TPA: acyltransferase [Rhizomicrobium sp.]|nr:acyltransferase [Rhizomicrobium sp.]